MKVFAINSSARIGGESKTELILNHLIKGMEEEGAQVEVVNIFKKKDQLLHRMFHLLDQNSGKMRPQR
ncbi:MAG: hypothetical protein KKH99_09600 [Proteobacteria bacterium]|nr:hypothetical protein [Pseudomonadota bacterium]